MADRKSTAKSRSPKKASAVSPRRGIQSVAVGYTILRHLASSPGPLFLREIARAVNMSTSKVYRHLASFVDVELVKQVEGNGRYDLGPAAIQLGLAALDRLDIMDVAIDSLTRVSEATNLDAHVTVWGDAGPTVIRWRGRPMEVAIRVGEGRVLPLVSSATGRIWCRYLPETFTKQKVDQELSALARQLGEPKVTVRERLARQLAAISETGLSHSQEERRRGFDALSGPVIGRDGMIVFAITVLGLHGDVDFSPFGRTATELRGLLEATSARLGYKVGTGLTDAESR